METETCSGWDDRIFTRLLCILTDYILYKKFTKLCICVDMPKKPQPWLDTNTL